MEGVAARAALAAKGRWASARLPGRAERFADKAGKRPDFAALLGWPAWIALDPPQQDRTGAVAVLLAAREALAEEIDGARLRRYAQIVGIEMLEAVVGDGGPGCASLPDPDDLTRLSGELLMASLDARAARLFGAAPRHDPASAELVRRADRLCRRIGCA